MKHLPLTYEVIKQRLLDLLRTQYGPGTRLPPGVVLAKRLGTGQRNTQRALAELAREGYVLSRPSRGTIVAPNLNELLRPPEAAPRPGPLAGRRIALVVSYPGVPFIRQMARAVKAALHASGATTRVHWLRSVRGVRLDELPGEPAHGFVLLNPDASMLVHARDAARVAAVSTTGAIADLLGPEANAVTIDDAHGGLLAGRAMRQRGCRSACFVGVADRLDPHAYEPTSAPRLRGFESGFGAELPARHRLRVTAFSHRAGALALRDYLKLNPRPAAVFAASDELAYGFALAGVAHGLEPQRDYQLVGFDGQFLLPRHDLGLMFATVAVPLRAMARHAARILALRLTDPDSPPQRVQLGCRWTPERIIWNRTSRNFQLDNITLDTRDGSSVGAVNP